MDQTCGRKDGKEFKLCKTVSYKCRCLGRVVKYKPPEDYVYEINQDKCQGLQLFCQKTEISLPNN